MSSINAHRTRFSACAAVLAAGVLLTSCSGSGGQEPGAPGQSGSSASASPAVPNPVPASTAPVPTPDPTESTPTESAPTEQAAPATVTTPNGLHTFTVPEGWTAVEAEPLPILSHDAGYVTPAAFTVLDGSGNPVARFYSGVSLDGAVVPGPGVVRYDTQEVPGYTNKMGRQVFFEFLSRPDWQTGGRGYYLQLASAQQPVDAGADPGHTDSPVFMPDGGLSFSAIIEPGAFTDDAAARAWMETGMYGQLKEMLLSLTYNG